VNGFLNLNSDGSFELGFSDTTDRGVWRFHDNGDVALVELTLDGENHERQCIAGKISTRTHLTILNPHILFNCDSLSDVEFIKSGSQEKKH
jgi:hypothetical protein